METELTKAISPDEANDLMTESIPFIKAHFFEAEEPAKSKAMSTDREDDRFGKGQYIPAPYDFNVLLRLYEYSNALRQMIDAYKTNIDGMGHGIDPYINPDSEEMTDEIEEWFEKHYKRMPRPVEVDSMRTAIKRKMRREKRKLDNFLKHCGGEETFITLRMKLREELEIIGNTYIEVCRNPIGEVVRFVRVPGKDIRLFEVEHLDVEEDRRLSFFTTEKTTVNRPFRRFCQEIGGHRCYFKSFGDPRIVSKKTGRVYKTIYDLLADDKTDEAANELIHLKVDSPRTPYGIPRWIGVILEVVGLRLAAEVNSLYFDNKSVPPMAILVSGGKFTADTVTRLESFINTRMKGTKNFHKVLVLEAEGAVEARIENPDRFANTGRVKIEMKPLTDAQLKDGLFMDYTAKAMDIIGQAFRLPRLLRGDMLDFNRSTADAALNFAEMQVFGPIRHAFDNIINHVLFSMGFRLWTFRSNAPIVRDPSAMADIIHKGMTAGAIIPEIGMELFGEVFNRKFPKLTADWVKQPVVLTQNKIPVQKDGQPLVFDQDPEAAAAAAENDPRDTPSPMAHTFGVDPSGGMNPESPLAAGNAGSEDTAFVPLATIDSELVKAEIENVPFAEWSKWLQLEPNVG